MKTPFDRDTKADRALSLARLSARLENLDEARRRMVLGAPKRNQPLYAKVLSNEASRPEAMKAKCQECVGFEEVIISIKECTVYSCPLWHHRPYQDKDVQQSQ